MVWHTLVYLLLLIAGTLYGLLRGAAPERIGAFVWLANNALTVLLLARSHAMFHVLELGVLGIDVSTLLALLGLALASNRDWLAFACGMHAGGVSVHLLKLLQPDLPAFGYAFGQMVWSYPIIFALLAGTWRHRRRLQEYGRDPCWSASFVSWTRRKRQIGATAC